MSDYYGIVHPNTWRQLCDSEIRWRWQDAYRAWRKEGKPEMPLRELFEKFEPGTLFTGEIGQMRGVTLIFAEQIP